MRGTSTVTLRSAAMAGEAPAAAAKVRYEIERFTGVRLSTAGSSLAFRILENDSQFQAPSCARLQGATPNCQNCRTKRLQMFDNITACSEGRGRRERT